MQDRCVPGKLYLGISRYQDIKEFMFLLYKEIKKTDTQT